MIRYSLICDKAHEFDAWFHDSAAFTAQGESCEITCPSCGSSRIAKAPMAPNVARRAPAPQKPLAPARAEQEIAKAIDAYREAVMKNADYVGPRFAEEARRIHYEETRPHGIYGEASLKDAKALIDEGIDCHPLPAAPKDRN